ncbi:MAG: hypothetical protein NTW60_01235 [Candidatus Wolfebacteria bacterium]|nr:hypothetical protein [Candidatus Wolfebacteria bacterium]
MRILKIKKTEFKKIIALISILAVVFAVNFSVIEKVLAAIDPITGETISATDNTQANLEQTATTNNAAGNTQANLESTGFVGPGGTAKSGDANPNGATIPDNQKTARSLGVVGDAIVFVAKTIMVAAAGLMDFALRLGSDVINLDSVRTGWGIVLNITNLGFVLAIIVIAFATIFRRESYGMKKTLWKLVVAALLVNFSLVIAGGIIDASNTVTNVFKDATLGKNGANLSVALGNALKPQALGDVSGANNSSWTEWLNNPLKAAFNLLASLIFIIIFTLLMVLAFLTLFLMFLMRALYLIILLILSPIVWLLWIFPDTSKYFKQWWSSFIRWNVFAPAVLFFIYIAVMTAATMQKTPLPSIAQSQSTVGSAAAALNAQTWISPEGGFFRYSAELFVILGLLFGGIYTANKLGIEGGSFGVSWAGKIGKGVGAYAGRKGRQLGTSPLRSERGKKVLEGMQRFAAGKRWVDFATLGTSALVRHAGAGLGKTAALGAEKFVEESKKRINGLDDYRVAKMMNTFDAPTRVAALQRLRQNKTLDLLPDASKFINDDTRNLMIKYGQPAPDYSSMERTVGFNDEMLRVAKGETIKRKVKQQDGTEVEKVVTLEDATRDFYKGFRAEHFNKMEVDEFFGQKPQFGLSPEIHKAFKEEAAKRILETVPDGLGNIYRNIKGVNMEEFHDRNLWRYVKQEAGGANMTTSEWLKAKHPKAYNFYTGFTAQSLGIGIDRVEEAKKEAKKEEKKEEKKDFRNDAAYL